MNANKVVQLTKKPRLHASAFYIRQMLAKGCAYEDASELRLYSFTNYYLSSLQQGLQTAHVVGEMAAHVLLTGDKTSPNDVFQHWAQYGKTIVILNGGNHADLNALSASLGEGPLPVSELFPVDYFAEDEKSLNSSTTCVGIVLPYEFYSLTLPPIEDTISWNVLKESSLGRFFITLKTAHMAR